MNMDMFDLCFGSSAHAVSVREHCVASCAGTAGRVYLDAVLSAAKCIGGLWGSSQVQSVVNSNGTFVFDDYLKDSELFSEIWRIKENQDELRERGAYPTGAFGMVIDANTPVQTLKTLYRKCTHRGRMHDWHDESLRAVVEMIDELGWAYIPLSDEVYCALFLAAREKSSHVREVESGLKRLGHAVYRVVEAGGKYAFRPFQVADRRQ